MHQDTYGGEDVTVTYALKKAAGISVVNCGAFHQHRPDQYMCVSQNRSTDSPQLESTPGRHTLAMAATAYTMCTPLALGAGLGSFSLPIPDVRSLTSDP